MRVAVGQKEKVLTLLLSPVRYYLSKFGEVSPRRYGYGKGISERVSRKRKGHDEQTASTMSSGTVVQLLNRHLGIEYDGQ